MLNDITSVRSWSKVNSGLSKMYRADVLHKFAVIQHFLFGSLLPFTREPSLTAEDEAALRTAHESDHDHCNKELPCCSNAIRFPSAVGAGTGAAHRVPNADPLIGMRRP